MARTLLICALVASACGSSRQPDLRGSDGPPPVVADGGGAAADGAPAASADAPAQVPADAEIQSTGGAGTAKPPCPAAGCQMYAAPGTKLVCFYGHCSAEPPGPCTDDSCPKGWSCLKDLEAHCPDCSRESACVPPVCGPVDGAPNEACESSGGADGSVSPDGGGAGPSSDGAAVSPG